ncbi:MAG: hypothetical protein ACKO55_02990, partial [Bacteroidota bacterium]
MGILCQKHSQLLWLKVGLAPNVLVFFWGWMNTVASSTTIDWNCTDPRRGFIEPQAKSIWLMVNKVSLWQP